MNHLSSYLYNKTFVFIKQNLALTYTCIWHWPWIQIMDFSLFLAIIKCNYVIYLWVDWYLDKQTLITKPTCWVILTWPWPLFDIDQQGHIFQFCCQIFSFFLMNLTHTWTKQHLWPNQHVGWFWCDLDLYVTLTDQVIFFISSQLIPWLTRPLANLSLFSSPCT